MASRLTSVLADPGRPAAVRQTNLLDTPAEAAFDRVARLAARLLEVPIVLVLLIEDDRQFFKACVGLPEPWASARQTPLSHSLCQHVVVARQPLAIGDTGRDGLARDNPLVRELGLAAYLGVPLIDPSGHALGSICVADHRPRDWTPEQVAILTDLAGLVMTQIQLRAELATRGELERRLIDVEASLQALLERLPGVVYALSPEAPNPVLYVSPQIQALLGVPVAPASGSRTATTRLASVASHRTAARRLTSGSDAQHCLAAHGGARVFPRRPRPALLATRAGSHPLDDLDQSQQPLTSEYRRLPHLLIIHGCILLGRWRLPAWS